MEQRSLRLGDIVDDYCPRERRLTNHAIVAIVEDAIRQTRCTTCDYEHVYKHAKEPRRRKPTGQSLFEQVMADEAGGRAVPARIVAPADPPPSVDGEVELETPAEILEATVSASADDHARPRADDVWPGHRTLIRATLPRTNSEVPSGRPIPEFTMHQKPQGNRARHARLIYGPQGDPFGRPVRDGQASSGRGHGAGDGFQGKNGNAADGQGNQPSKRRGRRRRRGGKRNR